ncbi:MAG: RsmE family RNA methyltransferase, partial [bacterium]
MALRDPLQARRVIVRRFYVPPGAIRGDVVTLRSREAHHAAVVLRLRPGERVVIVDGSRAEHIVELTTVTRREVTGRVVTRRPGSTISTEIVLVQGVAKGAKMDDVIRMGTELGVAAFIPVL